MPEGPIDDSQVVIEHIPFRRGLTVEDVEAFMSLGHSISEILTADHMAADFGLNAADLLAARRGWKSWNEIGAALPRPAPPTGPPSVEEAARITGLSPAEIRGWLDEGFDLHTVMNAVFAAPHYQMTVAVLLKQKGQLSWEEFGRKVAVNRSPRLLAETAKIGGRSEAELKVLIDQGYNLLDLRQAAHIANASGKSLEQVLEAWRGRDWLEVAQELTPGVRSPQRTTRPTGPPPGAR